MGIFDYKQEQSVMSLYGLLTHSDFKGNYEDTYVIELLFALLTIDLIVNAEMPGTFNSKEMYELAKESIRVFETEDNCFSYYSVRNWVEAILEYMKENNLKVKDVRKKSTIVLRQDVSKYLKQGDE